ncbi:hypothetical protein J3U11_04505, partial [Gilliamella sp. B2840]
MDKGLTHLINPLENGLSHGLKHGLKRSLKKGTAHNRYTLTVDGQSAPISVLQVAGNEQLNQPWHYTITFTSPHP